MIGVAESAPSSSSTGKLISYATRPWLSEERLQEDVDQLELSYEAVLRLFGLDAPGSAYCLYLTGSRVHGTATAASDYDFVAVVPGRCSALLHSDDDRGRPVDLCVYGLDNFVDNFRGGGFSCSRRQRLASTQTRPRAAL